MIDLRGQRFGIQPGALYGVDHRARSNRGARELVKFAAIFFHRESRIVLAMNHLSGEV